MIFRLLLVFLCLFSTLFSQLSENGAPSKALIEVLEEQGITSHNSWEEIVDETQKKWLRNPNSELWQITPKEDLHPEKTYALFSRLEMTQRRDPTQKEYTYALILGATEAPMQRRLAFLKEMWEKGLRYKQLVWLVGDRKADPTFEKSGENETVIAKKIYERATLPAEMRKVPVTFVDTPRKENQRRPTTMDTIHYWLSSNPEAGSALFIADAPFMNRQGSIAKKLMPISFTTEIAGFGFSFDYYKKEKRGLAILLDELARWIYLEYGNNSN